MLYRKRSGEMSFRKTRILSAGAFLIQRLEVSRFGTPALWVLNSGEGTRLEFGITCGQDFRIQWGQRGRCLGIGMRTICSASRPRAMVLEPLMDSR